MTYQNSIQFYYLLEELVPTELKEIANVRSAENETRSSKKEVVTTGKKYDCYNIFWGVINTRSIKIFSKIQNIKFQMMKYI